jgi:mycothiol synthase
MKLAEPLHVGGVVIQEVDYRSLSDDQIALLNDFENQMRAESNPEDPPHSLEMAIAEVRHQPAYLVMRQFWGVNADGTLAAQGYVYWRDVPENAHAIDVRIEVRPDHRGRGIARTLLSLLADVAEAERRPLLLSRTSSRVPAGETFARRVGADAAIADHTNRLVLADVDRDLVRRWVIEGPGRAPAYSLVTIDSPFPDDQLDEIVDLKHVMNTAPIGDFDIEDRRMTPQMYRQWERSILADGTERWGLFARHDRSGELVGYTEVFWNPHQPNTIFQGDTAVRPEHRGHALGKWLKGAMLERILAERSGIDDVRTGNADSNAAMLGINRALGFMPYIAHTGWQVRIERVRRYLEGSSV